VNGDDDKLQAHLASTLLRGHGEVMITLGTHPDDAEGATGEPVTVEQLDKAVTRLRATCTDIKADVTELYRDAPKDKPDSPFGCWLVRLRPAGVEEVMEVRVAVVGNVDAGKSTTLGVLTRGTLDDGRGKARVALFRHPHEIESGRTSSVGGEILGFSTTGQPIFPSTEGEASGAKREKLSWEAICKRASKVVSFIDLAGHERYFKTTLYGLSGCAPDYVMLMVGGNAGLIGMSKEHLGVALALNVPIAVCVTKVSFCLLKRLS
jgi:GTPase